MDKKINSRLYARAKLNNNEPPKNKSLSLIKNNKVNQNNEEEEDEQQLNSNNIQKYNSNLIKSNINVNLEYKEQANSNNENILNFNEKSHLDNIKEDPDDSKTCFLPPINKYSQNMTKRQVNPTVTLSSKKRTNTTTIKSTSATKNKALSSNKVNDVNTKVLPK